MKTPYPPRFSTHRAAACLLLALAAAVVPTSASAQSTSKASQFYEDALTRYAKKDYPGAIIQLKNALQIDPKQLPVQLLLGKALMQNWEMPAAQVALNEALRLGVDRAEVVIPLSRVYMLLGKQRELLEERTFDPAGLPRDVQAQLLLARAAAQLERNNSAAAFQAIEDARRLQPASADSWLAEIPLRVRARQFAEALTAADKALALEPKSGEAQFQKGSVLHARGDLAGALTLYDRALQQDPAHTEARVAQVGILVDQGRFADAGASITELQKYAPKDPRGAYLKSLLLQRNGDVQGSRAALKEVTDLLDAAPMEMLRSRPQFLMLNGMAHFGLNENEKAKQFLEEFHRAAPNTPATKLLARLYLGEGKAAQAGSLLEGYLRRAPRDSQALLLLANANRALGNHAKATALIQDALKAGDNPEFRTALGLSLVGEGKTSDGIRELETVYRNDPRNVQTATALVELYLRNGQASKALPLVRTLTKDAPSNASFQNMLGMALRLTDDAAGARQAYDKALQLDPKMTAATLNLARLEVSQRNLDAAGQRLRTLLESDNRNTEAMQELAVIAERRGALDEAQNWLQKARDIAPPKDLRWGLALVDFHLRHGARERALEALKLAQAQAPEDVTTLMAASRVHLALGDKVTAKSNLTTATRLAGFDPVQQMRIAELQTAANNPTGAAYSLEKALATQPDLVPAQVMLTEAELRMGDIAKADKRARDFTAQFPRSAVGYGLQGDVAMAKGQSAEALAAYRRAHQVEPSTTTVLRLFSALAATDGGQGAIALAEQWLKANPKDVAVHKALGDAFARTGRYANARASYEAAARLRPDDAEALNNLANVQLRLKDTAAAVKTAERALAMSPESPLVIDTLGWASFQNGQTDRALQLLRDARLRMPGNPEIRYHLAAVLAQQGKKEEALAEVEAALRGQPEDSARLADARQLLRSLR